MTKDQWIIKGHIISVSRNIFLFIWGAIFLILCDNKGVSTAQEQLSNGIFWNIMANGIFWNIMEYSKFSRILWNIPDNFYSTLF